MGDLVVPDEVGVRRGHPAVDVAHQRVQREVTQDGGGRGAQHRIDAAALQARFDLQAAGVASVDHLPHDVGDGQREQPAHRVRVGQHVVRRVLAVLGAVGDRAEREDRILAVAGEHVRPRHTPVDEQAMAVGLAVLDDRRIAGPVRREHLAEVLVVPAERGHVLVVAVEDAGLARPGLRRQVALPSGDLMCAAPHPAGQRRHGARRDRPPQDGFGEAVDLQEEHAGHIGRCGRLEAVDHPPHRLALEHGVVVEREHAAEDDGRRGHEQRREDRRPPAVDDQSVEQLVDRHEERAVQEEDEQPGRPEERPGEVAGHDRPDHRVQDRQERRRRGTRYPSRGSRCRAGSRR